MVENGVAKMTVPSLSLREMYESTQTSKTTQESYRQTHRITSSKAIFACIEITQDILCSWIETLVVALACLFIFFQSSVTLCIHRI